MSDWEKKPSEQQALTSWGERTEGQVRIKKKNQANDRYSRSGEHRRRDKPEWGKEPSERWALTSWRAQIEGQVRVGKETERETGTHLLERADGRTNQIGKRNRARDGHSLPGEGRRKDKSDCQKKPSKRWELMNWRAHIEGQIRMGKETEHATALTNWKAHTEGQVRVGKGSERATTHQLESTYRGISQNGKKKPGVRRHSPTGEGRQRYESE
jgi:hypothetical protein